MVLNIPIGAYSVKGEALCIMGQVIRYSPVCSPSFVLDFNTLLKILVQLFGTTDGFELTH